VVAFSCSTGKRIKLDLARVFSFPVWIRGYAPETPIFLFTKAYLSFLSKKIGFFIMERSISISVFLLLS
jgi:hypothetical protein